MNDLERRLAAARVSAYLTAPSWARSPYAGTQAEQILALVLDTESCGATSSNGAWRPAQVCYCEKGHEHMHMDVNGGPAWDLTDEELEVVHERQIQQSIEAHDRMLDATLEDR